MVHSHTATPSPGRDGYRRRAVGAVGGASVPSTRSTL
ncbi:hypothetical protein Ae505Ps2_2998 [Pseudonocardia sp. Ae505_Ps2]|nr:hypothetical protein Ae505Ps2_2998 [Pseudonocardia sp. Ae505_Ps2]